MLFNYIFEHKLISFKNFIIVLPATFVNKSNICQKHPHSQPKHVSMNNWNNTEYILVILQTSNIYIVAGQFSNILQGNLMFKGKTKENTKVQKEMKLGK